MLRGLSSRHSYLLDVTVSGDTRPGCLSRRQAGFFFLWFFYHFIFIYFIYFIAYCYTLCYYLFTPVFPEFTVGSIWECLFMANLGLPLSSVKRTFELDGIQRSWTINALINQRSMLVRSRSKERAGSPIDELRGAEIAELTALIAVFS